MLQISIGSPIPSIVSLLVAVFLPSPCLAKTAATEAAVANAEIVESLHKSGDAKFAQNDYTGALSDYSSALRQGQGNQTSTLFRLAKAASKTKHANLGFASLRAMFRTDANLRQDPKIQALYQELTSGDADTAQTMRTVEGILRDVAAKPGDSRNAALCRQARNLLRPYLSDPWQENLELWRLGGILADASDDDALAAVCVGAIKELEPNAANEARYAAVLDTLIRRPLNKGILEGRGYGFADIVPLPEYATSSFYAKEEAITSEEWHAITHSLPPAKLMKMAKLLLDSEKLLPDLDKAHALLEESFSAWKEAGFSKTEDWRHAASRLSSDYFNCIELRLRALDTDKINRFVMNSDVERYCEIEPRLPHPDKENHRYDLFLMIGNDLRSGKLPGVYKDCPVNPIEAEYWLLQACNVKMERQPVEAWYALGDFYSTNVPNNPNPKFDAIKSVQFFLKAGESTNNDDGTREFSGISLYNAGIAYYNGGPEVGSNRFLAVQLFKKAEGMNYASATKKLADPSLIPFKRWDRW